LTIFQAILLGVVQGLTEFLPVSSTAHLILTPWLLGWATDPAFARSVFAFNVLVQWGTLVGVFAYFWRDIGAIVRGVLIGLARGKPFETFEARLGWWVIVATIPALIVGLLLKSQIEAVFSAYALVAGVLIVAALLLVAAERFGQRNRNLTALNTTDAVVVGLWQTLALFPGVSRSSATIAGGMLRHLERSAAARFSFLMSIPALLGAGVVVLSDLLADATLLQALALPLAAGFIAAAVSGYLVIRWLLGYLQKQSLGAFAVYRVVFGVLCLIVASTRG
jgi:undecaprenyl-diphosphatase